MCNEITEAIEELKRIRLELFRSAASIDMAIEDLELIKDDPAGPEFIKSFVVERIRTRREVVDAYGWDKLNEKENEVWQKLINNI